jgi:adenylylsulfate kinase-like enzyme
MYAKARRGELTGFTGIDDPYERPESPEITLDTVAHPAADNARKILGYLIERGFIAARGPDLDVLPGDADPA